MRRSRVGRCDRWGVRRDGAVPCGRPVGRRAGGASDATVQFRAVGRSADAPVRLSDATVQFRAVGPPAGRAGEASDATVQFRAVGRPRGRDAGEACRRDGAVPGGRPAGRMRPMRLSDATVQFRVISQLARPDYAVPRDQPADLRPGSRQR